jgi:hypothetical protein
MSDKTTSVNMWRIPNASGIIVDGVEYVNFEDVREYLSQYTFIHDNPEYDVIPKGENIICQGSMMYNPNNHKIVDLDEYHVIKKSDVDVDAMEALDRLNWIQKFVMHTDGQRPNWTDDFNLIRTTLIAQSKPTTSDGEGE